MSNYDWVFRVMIKILYLREDHITSARNMKKLRMESLKIKGRCKYLIAPKCLIRTCNNESLKADMNKINSLNSTLNRKNSQRIISKLM